MHLLITNYLHSICFI